MDGIKQYFVKGGDSYNINSAIHDLYKHIKEQESLCSRLENYADYLTSLIKLSKEYNMEVITLAKLIDSGNVKNINCIYSDEFVKIFLDSLEDNETKYCSFFNTELDI